MLGTKLRLARAPRLLQSREASLSSGDEEQEEGKIAAYLTLAAAWF
jgi:hypothetical protein